MIKVIYNTNSLKIKGHANFADYGKDIVCAAVSSLVTCTVNNIYSLNKESINYKDDGSLIEINVSDDSNSLILLNNLIEMLKELANNYPKNIKIESEK